MKALDKMQKIHTKEADLRYTNFSRKIKHTLLQNLLRSNYIYYDWIKKLKHRKAEVFTLSGAVLTRWRIGTTDDRETRWLGHGDWRAACATEAGDVFAVRAVSDAERKRGRGEGGSGQVGKLNAVGS